MPGPIRIRPERLVAQGGGNARFFQALLQVTVQSSLGTPSGTVEFLEGGKVVAAATLLSNGSLAIDPALFLLPGTHSITASYVGTSGVHLPAVMFPSWFQAFRIFIGSDVMAPILSNRWL